MKLIKGGTMLALLAMMTTAATACPTCFGAKGDPVVESIGWAILFLLVMIIGTVGGIIAFFVNVAKRSSRYEQQLQEGTAEWGELPELLEDKS